MLLLFITIRIYILYSLGFHDIGVSRQDESEIRKYRVITRFMVHLIYWSAIFVFARNMKAGVIGIVFQEK